MTVEATEKKISPPAGVGGPLLFIVKTGLLAGFLDISAAFIDAYASRGTAPTRVLQFIASGVFGRSAFSGGQAMALWGCVFHFFFASTWSSLFFLMYPRINFLGKRWIASGILYGVFVWIMMNMVVLPLSNTPAFSRSLTSIIKATTILIFMIGLPISYRVHQYYSKKHRSDDETGTGSD